MRATADPQPIALGLRAWRGRFGAMAQAHRHYELELNYLLRGTVTYLIGGAVVTLPARRLCAIWGGAPHQIIGGGAESAETFWVTVPLAQALAWDLPRTLVERLLREGCALEDATYPGDERALAQWVADLHDPSMPPPRAMLLEMEARLCRLAARLEPARQPAPAKLSPGSGGPAGEIPPVVERLASFLATRYREPVTVEDAARAAHVHAHYAMALFRRHTGLTLHQYLTVQRVAHAQRLLATTRDAVVDVAFDSGFASVSRFYAAFKAADGQQSAPVSLAADRCALVGSAGLAAGRRAGGAPRSRVRDAVASRSP